MYDGIWKWTWNACDGRGAIVLRTLKSIKVASEELKTHGVVNEPRRFQLLDGGILGISHFKTWIYEDEILARSAFVQQTLFLLSKVHEAPELPPIPTSIAPRPRPPVPRAAVHLIDDAPSPRLSWTTTFSRTRVVRRDVNVISKEANRALVNEWIIMKNPLDLIPLYSERSKFV